MIKIDEFSYNCGVMDCFGEMVKARMKKLALAHPSPSRIMRDRYIPFVEQMTQKYGINYYLDDEPLLSDLFPLSMNKDTYNIIFYHDEKDIQEYCLLKQIKKEAIQKQEYEHVRQQIAYRLGKLLCYSDETIENYIQQNKEKK